MGRFFRGTMKHENVVESLIGQSNVSSLEKVGNQRSTCIQTDPKHGTAELSPVQKGSRDVSIPGSPQLPSARG